MILSPSILSADFAVLGEQIEKTVKAGAQYIHIDVMDGMFVPSISYGMPVIASIRKTTDKVFDTHLMIEEPERYLDDFAKSGADLITFHLEATGEPQQVIDRIHELGLKAGIAIKPGTPIETVYPFTDQAEESNRPEMVLVMTVEPGFGGQKLIPETLDKVRTLREHFEKTGNVDTDIQVDGGINAETIDAAIEAGANVIVAGSSVFKGDIEQNVADLMSRF